MEPVTLLGPFIGHVTATSALVWLHVPGAIVPNNVLIVDARIAGPVHATDSPAPISASRELVIEAASLDTGLARFTDLGADTSYRYAIRWKHDGTALDLQGLAPEELTFRTLPEEGFAERLDFLLLSCHDPTRSMDDGFRGHAMWAAIPAILKENDGARFAILAGDQVYADSIAERVRAATDDAERGRLYLEVYQRFWSDIHYRRVLCSLPSYLMWDDHDIDDGWGSRPESFLATAGPEQGAGAFKDDWLSMLAAARKAFRCMQASRNPPGVSEDIGCFDTCFRVGRVGFVLADLRTNRNVRRRMLWEPAQRERIRSWIEAQRADLDVLFFVSPVVFSHGDPGLARMTAGAWPRLLKLVAWLTQQHGIFRWILGGFSKDVGDITDDLADSWGSDQNAPEAEVVLDMLFELQNPSDESRPVNVAILSGDIHTPGYSMLYSNDSKHAGSPVIPHVVSSPVASRPFSWFVEAIYRSATKVVALGDKGRFSAQVNHHFSHRCVTVVSLRYFGDETFLKVKFYLEGFPEPQTAFFDLKRSSHLERLAWSAT